jgi:hypothetical protein
MGMSAITLLIKEYWPLIVAFVVGLLLGARGCESPATETITIEKPVATVQYVDRWKTDTVRHVSREVSVRFDTITLQKIERVLDTLLLIDTVSIVETWLSEQLNYDTIARFKESAVRISWSNYQNRSENLRISLQSPAERLRFGVYARGGVQTDFKGATSPAIGGGLMLFRKRIIFGVDYGYSTNHQITGTLGYHL